MKWSVHDSKRTTLTSASADQRTTSGLRQINQNRIGTAHSNIPAGRIAKILSSKSKVKSKPSRHVSKRTVGPNESSEQR